jgi:hypothetical protein
MDPLVGTWRLVSWTASIADQKVTPFGGPTTGLITYTADGRMWGSLMLVNRDNLDAPTLASAAPEERERAAAGYLNYAGTYRFDGDDVIHEVEMSLYPNWIGSDQRRHVEWRENETGGNDLILSAAYVDSKGETVLNRLRWRRLEDWR